MFDVEDKWFEKELNKIRKVGIELVYIDTPMFITKTSEFVKMCPQRKKPKYKMTDFYISQRKKLGILCENDKPIGGKWTYDTENRKKIPKTIKPPPLLLSLIHI